MQSSFEEWYARWLTIETEVYVTGGRKIDEGERYGDWHLFIIIVIIKL